MGASCLLLLARPVPAAAQDVERQLRANQARLDSIRRERQDLEGELQRLRRQAHSIATELANLERQKTATSRLVNELDRQMRSLRSSLDTVTVDLLLAEDALAEKRAILLRRLVEIYRRGPLWTFQVLFSAESFGHLLSRYKYLYLVSRQDRALVEAVEQLRRRVAAQRRDLLRIQGELAARRAERSRELNRYLALERQHTRSLRETQATERLAVARLDSLSRDARRLNELIAALERARREAAARRPPSGPPSVNPSDLGKLDWPLAGELIYRYGRVPRGPNTAIWQNGIGIRAEPGTPVRAVAAGTVVLARVLNTYGHSVMVDHGGGFSTLYLYLSQLRVREGQQVVKGDILGLSGGERSEEGPHIEFQVRGEGGIALDPLNWLKARP